MPILVPNQPLEQREPVLVVQNRLAPGRHRFTLVVVNARGVASEPDEVTVTVRRGGVVGPGVVLTPVDLDPVVLRPPRPPQPPVVLTPVVPPRVGPPVGPPAGPPVGPPTGPPPVAVVTPAQPPVPPLAPVTPRAPVSGARTAAPAAPRAPTKASARRPRSKGKSHDHT